MEATPLTVGALAGLPVLSWLASRPVAAFPGLRAGRLPHWFRGVLVRLGFLVHAPAGALDPTLLRPARDHLSEV